MPSRKRKTYGFIIKLNCNENNIDEIFWVLAGWILIKNKMWSLESASYEAKDENYKLTCFYWKI